MKQKGIQKVIENNHDIPVKSSERKSTTLTAEEIATKAIQEANGFVVSN